MFMSHNCPSLSLQMLWGLFKDPCVKLVGHAGGRVHDHADVGNPHNLMADNFIVGLQLVIIIVKVVIAWFIPEGIFPHEALDGDKHRLEGESGRPPGPAPCAEDGETHLALSVQVRVEPDPPTVWGANQGLWRRFWVVWRALKGEVEEASIIGRVFGPCDDHMDSGEVIFVRNNLYVIKSFTRQLLQVPTNPWKYFDAIGFGWSYYRYLGSLVCLDVSGCCQFCLVLLINLFGLFHILHYRVVYSTSLFFFCPFKDSLLQVFIWLHIGNGHGFSIKGVCGAGEKVLGNAGPVHHLAGRKHYWVGHQGIHDEAQELFWCILCQARLL